jgi:hypothetical protein
MCWLQAFGGRNHAHCGTNLAEVARDGRVSVMLTIDHHTAGDLGYRRRQRRHALGSAEAGASGGAPLLWGNPRPGSLRARSRLPIHQRRPPERDPLLGNPSPAFVRFRPPAQRRRTITLRSKSWLHDE